MSATGYTYKGPGRVYGVPARDITAEEFEAFTGRQRGLVLRSGWYVATEVAEAPLASLKRADLNAMATELGIEAPDALDNKDVVIAAIEAARAPQVPETPEGGEASTQEGGK